VEKVRFLVRLYLRDLHVYMVTCAWWKAADNLG